MANEKKVRDWNIIQDFYLYPYRGKPENVARAVVWLASWIVGILIQPTTDFRMLGGAYFIFAASLLMEFVFIERESLLGRIIQGLFCTAIIALLLGSFYLVFSQDNGEFFLHPSHWIAPVGWLVIGVMCVETFLSLFDKGSKRRKEERENAFKQKQEEAEAEREIFYARLNGTPGEDVRI